MDKRRNDQEEVTTPVLLSYLVYPKNIVEHACMKIYIDVYSIIIERNENNNQSISVRFELWDMTQGIYIFRRCYHQGDVEIFLSVCVFIQPYSPHVPHIHIFV